MQRNALRLYMSFTFFTIHLFLDLSILLHTRAKEITYNMLNGSSYQNKLQGVSCGPVLYKPVIKFARLQKQIK